MCCGHTWPIQGVWQLFFPATTHLFIYLQNEKVLEGGAEKRVPISCRRGDFVVVEKMYFRGISCLQGRFCMDGMCA